MQNTAMMSFSPYKDYFKEEIAEWELTLRCVLDVVDVWGKV